jgi:hypothetical protein
MKNRKKSQITKLKNGIHQSLFIPNKAYPSQEKSGKRGFADLFLTSCQTSPEIHTPFTNRHLQTSGG